MSDSEVERFSPDELATGSFRLLELPPDLCKLVESFADDLRHALPWSMLSDSLFMMQAPV
jgi:hypothetical protein